MNIGKFLDTISNMSLEDKSEISITKAILLLYLIIGVNYTKNLYGNQLNENIKNSLFAQHLIGFILMLVIIIEIGNIRKPMSALIYSLLAYSIFVLSTKLDIYWNLTVIGLLMLYYFYDNHMKVNEDRIKKDDSLDDNNIEFIKSRYKRIRTIFLIVLCIVLSYGLMKYLTRKEEEYGDDFDTIKFLFNGNKKYYLTK